MDAPTMTPLEFSSLSPEQMQVRANAFYREMRRRRTVREFSDRAVPRELIETCLLTAGTAPNGANLQPWHFVAVSDPACKRRIRSAAESEEREFYDQRATPEWKEAIAPLGTDAAKPFLETAPWLIAIFAVNHRDLPDGRRQQMYYPKESTGIATGILVTALHQAGLATLTHTPSPMAFLNEILGRPPVEKPFLLLVVGYPAVGAQVPEAALHKKSLAEIATFL
ncbi:MAG: nitroreductase family protein [Cephaloticoccus sp.]|nr:nitroreductase family protein [Cephaloticoccus sp.]MCF7761240.1 nitroreductase family protein [Cephaloticoccus sp.]